MGCRSAGGSADKLLCPSQFAVHGPEHDAYPEPLLRCCDTPVSLGVPAVICSPQEDSMILRLYAALGISLLATTFVVAQAGRTVQVDVNYTGSGTVDGSHKIYVALWDSADFSGGPAAVKPV